MLASWLVATGTLQTVVFSNQWEIGCLVRERGFVEWDDVCITSLMVGMAVGTVPAFGVSVATMKALPGCDVVANILVTSGAQLFLFVAIEFNVARSTFLLDIGVPGDDFAGHNQRFQLGMCVLKYQHAEYQYESRKKCVSSHRLSSCSVHVYGEYVEQRRQNHQEEDWQVQDVPQGKESLI